MSISFRTSKLEIPLSRRTGSRKPVKANRLPDDIRRYILEILSTGPALKCELDQHCKSHLYFYLEIDKLRYYRKIVIVGSGKRGDRKRYHITQAGLDELNPPQNQY